MTDPLPPTCNGLCAADEPHRAPCPLADSYPAQLARLTKGLGLPLMPPTLSARAARYRAELDAAYAAHPELPAGALEAIGDRETLWGWAPEYRLADGTQAAGRPDGTGDWAPRTMPLKATLAIGGIRLQPAKPQGVMPADSLGWGRGLMQVDLAAHPEFCARTCRCPSPGVLGLCTFAWACARCNTEAGAAELAEHLRQAGGYVPEAVCAYNAGWGAVLRARAEAGVCGGAPVEVLDKHTTGGNYVSDVLRRREDFLRETAQPPAAPAEEK